MNHVRQILIAFVLFILPGAALAQGDEEVPETAASAEAAAEYKEVQALSELEAMSLSPVVLGTTKTWSPTLIAPYSGTLASVRRDAGQVAELYHGLKKVPVGAELLTIPAVRDRFQKTSMFDLVVHQQPSVRAYLDFFDGRGKSILASWMARMGRYEPLIRQTLREEGLPEDLIFVAMIESGFSPRATSPAAAVGVWQFIPTTGSEMGLAITRYVDERRDPVKATRAACGYLQRLYTKFGSWPLALAAYNGGPGLVGSTVSKFNSNDYWYIQRSGGLYDETRRYVPKIIAAGLVTKNADVFGLDGIQKVEPFSFDVVEVAHNTRLSLFADAVGVSVKKLRELNPELLQPQTPPGSGLYRLRIPRGTTAKFVANHDKISARDGADHEVYRVKFGETLRDVAESLNVAPRILRAVNDLESGARVAYGTELLVPTKLKGTWKKKSASKKVTLVVPKKNPSVTRGKRYFYKVNSGDTLSAVSRGLGVKPGDLILWNYLDPRAKLQRGMVLQVFLPAERDLSTLALLDESRVNPVIAGSTAHKKMRKSTTKKRFYHRVKSGQSLWIIARKYRVTVKDLKRWNRSLRKSNMLQPGQKIVVYPGKKKRSRKRRKR